MNNLYIFKSLTLTFGMKLRTLLAAVLLSMLLLFISLPAAGAYIVHRVTGKVTLVKNGNAVPLKAGMTLSPSDEVDIPEKAQLEILNDLDSRIYTSVSPGRSSVMRLMLNAKLKAADNSANVSAQLALGKSGAKPDGRVYVEKGMVKREIATVEADITSLYPGIPDAMPPTVALQTLISSVPGTVGIAFVSDTDTVTVNNGVRYPMMSVFKLHQALAVADKIENEGHRLDSALYIPSFDIDRNTWSPMLEKYGDEDFMITVGELLRYALTGSDNNASNLLFKRIISPLETDRYVKSIAPDTTFRILYSEAVMKDDHSLSYNNYTTPLAAALLINKVFTAPILSTENQDSIRTYLTEVTTGADRLGVAIEGKSEILFGHKTGSGYRNDHGELIGHNDVGYFRLPDGKDYSLAVFIRDFNGTEEEASKIIAAISRYFYTYLTNR